MAYGRLANAMRSAFVRTPPERAVEIVRNLLAFSDPPNPRGQLSRTVFDPTCGEGDLLEPCLRLGLGNALHLFGVEIAADRADTSRSRLPDATIVTCAIEAVSVTRGSMSLVLANPPYFLEDSGKRAEYRIIADAGEALIPGVGIMVAIIPARSAWNKTMVNHWSRNYTHIRCWKFPDAEALAGGDDDEEGAFERYSQVVIIGVRREKPLDAPEPAEQARLLGWQWREPKKASASPWAQGFAPPVLPASPIADPYPVPPTAGAPRPELVVWRADEAVLLRALRESGAHLTPAWKAATEWQEKSFLEEPAMPPAGFAHLASLLLTGVMDGEVVQGPDKEHYAFTTFVTQRWVDVQLDEEVIEEQRKKGVIALSVRQQEDHAVLGVLTLSGPRKGELRYLQGEAVYAFLEPWLGILSEQVFARYTPIYNLDPSYRQALVCAQIGLDKQLPGAEHPGLSDAQVHRVCAMERVLLKKGFVAIQGEPGTGKTRQITALMALFADAWRRRSAAVDATHARPWWMREMCRVWRTNPRLLSLLEAREGRAEFLPALAATHPPAPVLEAVGLAPALCDSATRRVVAYRDLRAQVGSPELIYPQARPETIEPAALPFLVAAPRRTLITGWVKEIKSAWPEAEVLVIEDHLDVLIWLQRCATSPAPAVVALFPHSLTRAFGREWKPAVLERKVEVTVPDLEPGDARVLVEYEPIYSDAGELKRYQHRATGEILTKQELVSHFYCPACQGLIRAIPRGGKPTNGDDGADDEDSLVPVTSLTYFEKKPRWCECERAAETLHRPRAAENGAGAGLEDEGPLTCGSALWSETRVAPTKRKYPQLPFAQFAKAAEVLQAHRANRAAQGLPDESSPGRQTKKTAARPQIALSEEERLRRERRAAQPSAPTVRLTPLSAEEAGELLARLRSQVWLSFRERRLLDRFLAADQAATSRVLELSTTPLTLIALVEPCAAAPEGYTEVRETVDGEEGVVTAYTSPDGPTLTPIYSRWARRWVDGHDAPHVTRHTRPVKLAVAETGEDFLVTSYYRLIAPPADSFSPYAFLYRFFKGAVALSSIDESHNARGRTTDIAQSVHFAQLSAQNYLYASGTHYGGALDGFFYYWFRFNPQFWLRLGLTWNDAEKAVELYGVVQHWSKEYESDARRGSGKTDVRESTVPAPGISARLIPYLLACIVYLSVLDVGAYMPEREEIPDIVPMEDTAVTVPVEAAHQAVQEARERLSQAAERIAALRGPEAPPAQESAELAEAAQAEEQARQYLWQAQEGHQRILDWADSRDLNRHYRGVAETLEGLARRRNPAARMAQGTVPKWFSVLPCTSPSFEVKQATRDEWGNITGHETLITTPILAWEHTYPLEIRLIEILRKELDEGRRTMIYFEQNDIRSMARRLQWVLQENELSSWVLPNDTEAEDREEAIRKAILQQGHRIVIVPYRRVSEGLNLQDVVDSIVWFEMAMNLFTLDQASRRAWRLGKTNLVRIYYLAYAHTAAYRKLRNLGSRSGAASAFSGEPPKGALVEHAGANKTTLARISLGLEGLEEAASEDVQAAAARLRADFKRRGEELRETLRKGRQWFGVEDKLPALMAEIRAFLAEVRDQRTQQESAGAPYAVEALSAQAALLAFPELETPQAEEGEVGEPATELQVLVAGANGHVRVQPSWLELAEQARAFREEKARAKRERAATRRARATTAAAEGAQPVAPPVPALTLFDLLFQETADAAAGPPSAISEAEQPVLQMEFAW
jgi:hypothetical protein